MQKEITLSDLKQMMAELVMSQKENARQFKETKEMFKDTDRKFKETDRKFKETDRKFKETDRKFKETDLKFEKSRKELDNRFAETTKNINKVMGKFDSQWGKLMESLVEGDLVKLFKERGIEVHDTSTRIDGNYKGQNYEFDIIAHNGNEVIVVEIKTTLKVKDVKRFVDKLTKIKTWMPRLKGNRIYGTIAYLKADEQSKAYALNQKLFVIRATGDSASIVNEMDFEPRYF